MKAFADLYTRLDATTSSNAKLAALQDYFHAAPQADAAWAAFFLAGGRGGRPRQLVPTRLLRELAIQAGGVPEWLFEESYQAVGDLAETIALLLPESEHASSEGLAPWVEDKLLPLRGVAPDQLTARLLPLRHPPQHPRLPACGRAAECPQRSQDRVGGVLGAAASRRRPKAGGQPRRRVPHRPDHLRRWRNADVFSYLGANEVRSRRVRRASVFAY